ncbi:MAG: T9SS type A sorting domain-containing protein [candidate division WOR-3 bacterium]|nr:T9SS type A sorting domain-containing protein [candidate division WOR-3 bacterium]
MVEIIIGTDSTYSYHGPLNRSYNYSTHEAIYLQSEIGISGVITHIAYYKHLSVDLSPIENVAIYLKHTGEEILANGIYSLMGYTEVFTGTFTNNAHQGWMGVSLTTSFPYNNSDNLQILIIKGYQAYLAIQPIWWRYTTTSPIYRTRQAYNDNTPPTNLNQTYNRPNIRLMIRQVSDLIENDFNTHLIISKISATPNPFTNKTNISFNLSEAQKVSLKIYDTKGKLIRTLVDGVMSSGVHNITWDGTDEHRLNVAKGIYFYILETPKQRFSKKLILMR